MRYSIPATATTTRLDVVSTNKVLRNAYLLLALTLLPTIMGAFIGASFAQIVHSGIGFVVFLAGMFGFQFMVIKNRERPAGIAWLLLFTLFMGVFLGPTVGYALGSFSNGASMVATAAGGTAAIFFGIAGYASVTKRDFSKMSIRNVLTAGIWMLFASSILNYFLQSSAISLALSSLVIVVASGFILHVINRTVRGGEKNYIMVAMTLYIMLLNIFQSLLHLMMIFSGNRD